MIRYCLLLCFALAACDHAGPGFRGIDKVEREVDGSRFTLRTRDSMVEAIRTNPEVLPRFNEVARKAAFAAEAETGCEAAWVEGDAAMMLIGLSCNGAKAPEKPKKRKTLYCDIDDIYTNSLGTTGSLTCYQ